VTDGAGTIGGNVLKHGYIGILLIFLLLAALAVSGCSGGSTTVSPTPAVGPGSPGGDATPTPAASMAPAGDIGQQKTAGQLVNGEGLHAYRYRVTQSNYGVNQTFYVDVAYGEDTFKGMPAKHTVIVQGYSAANGTPMPGTPVDVYTSKADGGVLGGTKKIVINGQTKDEDMSITEASAVLLSDIVNNARLNGDVALTYAGPETITVDNKTYDCVRYSFPIGNTTETEWYTPDAPMPIRSIWSQGKNYVQITELLSWS
jgi:hypothetical protein